MKELMKGSPRENIGQDPTAALSLLASERQLVQVENFNTIHPV